MHLYLIFPKDPLILNTNNPHKYSSTSIEQWSFYASIRIHSLKTFLNSRHIWLNLQEQIWNNYLENKTKNKIKIQLFLRICDTLYLSFMSSYVSILSNISCIFFNHNFFTQTKNLEKHMFTQGVLTSSFID